MNIFKVGCFYKNNNGGLLHIVGKVEHGFFYDPEYFLAEDERGFLRPIRSTESDDLGYIKISKKEYSKIVEKRRMIDTKKHIKTTDQRWEDEDDSYPESVYLARKIAEMDELYGGDGLDLKFGGDGDNGEHLIHLFDCFFDSSNHDMRIKCAQ